MTDDELANPPARPLPESQTRGTRCEGCRELVVWARTTAGENGRGGKLMPLDPFENPAGNVAVTNPHRGVLYARALHKGETVERPLEWRAMPHFATCYTRTKPEVPQNVIDLAEAKRKRKARRR